jgi:hypothetical protein
MVSGGAAGSTALLLVYPLDYPKVKLATDVSK